MDGWREGGREGWMDGWRGREGGREGREGGREGGHTIRGTLYTFTPTTNHEVGIANVMLDHTPSQYDHTTVNCPHSQAVDPADI